MMLSNLILVGSYLVQTVASQKVYYPKPKTNFTKAGTPAQWAPGHPKAWGSETFQYGGAIRSPEERFYAAITPDEKYLIISNGTHLQFTDLDKNATVAAISLGKGALDISKGMYAYVQDLKILPAAQGGYHVLHGIYDSYADQYAPNKVLRLHIGADLQPLSSGAVYDDSIYAISAESSRVALRLGEVYDLTQPDSSPPISTLPFSGTIVRELSFGPDGVLLVSAVGNTADIWNTTSGEKVQTVFPYTDDDSWTASATISPDGRHVAVSVAGRSLLLYDLANPSAEPKQAAGQGMYDAPAWSPSGHQVAVADYRRLRVFSVPTMELVQMWEIPDELMTEFYGVTDVAWVDGGKKITWVCHWGRYLYDFETNTEQLWTVRTTDHSWGRESIYILKNRGYVVTVNGDSTVRFWKD